MPHFGQSEWTLQEHWKWGEEVDNYTSYYKAQES